MNRKNVMIGVLVLVALFFGFNQYQQYQQIQEKKRIEAEIKAQNDQLIQSFEEHQKKGNPLTNRDRGTL